MLYQRVVMILGLFSHNFHEFLFFFLDSFTLFSELLVFLLEKGNPAVSELSSLILLKFFKLLLQLQNFLLFLQQLLQNFILLLSLYRVKVGRHSIFLVRLLKLFFKLLVLFDQYLALHTYVP